MPFRAWCVHCNKGKAKGHPHRKSKEEDKGSTVPVVGMDYMFMSEKQEEGEERGMPILVIKDSKTKVVRARVVPKKGRDPYAIRRATADIAGLGHKRMVIKTDGEPAIRALKDGIKGESQADIIPEESPGYDSQSNGMIERAIQQVQGQFRTIKDGMEARYGTKLEGHNPMVPWMVAHAADCITRYHVHNDGRTGYQNLKGRVFKKEVCEFGENVLFLRPNTRGKDKFEVRWEEGLWLGIHEQSNEVIIGTDKGVLKARDVRRRAWNVQFNTVHNRPPEFIQYESYLPLF